MQSLALRCALFALAVALLGRATPSHAKCSWEVLECNLVPVSEEVAMRRECYHNSHFRASSPLSGCPPGTEQNGALCYPLCDDGFSGSGPVCWQNCPNGFRNDPAHCGKTAPESRGVGYPWRFGDTPFSLDGAWKRCEQENTQGCEQDGAVVYPKCRPGFHPAGCCICSPDCPEGMLDIGVSCQKQTRTRGGGSAMICPSGKEQIGALCYDDCPAGWKKTSVMCQEEAETCRNVPLAPTGCPAIVPFSFMLTQGGYCSTQEYKADTLEHAKQLAENCTGAQATHIQSYLVNECDCKYGDRLPLTSGFSYCLGEKCQRCYAGKWSDATDCRNDCKP